MRKGVLILSGYNIRAVVAFCRWAKSAGVPFHLVARNADDSIFLTAFKENVFLIRSREGLEAEEFCAWIAELRAQCSYEEVLVLPSTEYLNRFLLDSREIVERAGGIVPLVDKELYARISDKYSFGNVCRDFGICVPEEYATLPESLPFVAKPRVYSSANGRLLKPCIVRSEADLLRFRATESLDDFYFQKFIDGESLYWLASIARDEAPVFFSQKNLIQQANGGSIVLAQRSDFHQSVAAVRFVELCAVMNFHGLIMIEVRHEKESGEYFMIEANPRLWGPMQLVVDNGIDMFGPLLREHGFTVAACSPRNDDGLFYFWSGGLDQGSAPDYHDYSNDRFVGEADSIDRCNLFRREDSIELFLDELAKSAPGKKS